MKTFIRLNNSRQEALPPPFTDVDDVRFTDEFAKIFIREYSKEGSVILDPFAGFGTTIVAAETLGRKPIGIEYDGQKVEYVRTLTANKDAIIEGDSRKLLTYKLPKFDFCLTSPPYMGKGDKENPFTSYKEAGGDYGAYLSDMGAIYGQVAKLANEGARVVIEVSNIKQSRGVTTLAWDVCSSVSEHLHFDGEVVVAWEPSYGHGYDHSYCLVFSN